LEQKMRTSGGVAWRGVAWRGAFSNVDDDAVQHGDFELFMQLTRFTNIA